MSRIINLFVLSCIKLFARFFYTLDNQWLHDHTVDPWRKVRLLVFLNHTSLYEPLFLGAAPWRFIWRVAGRMIIPAADVTMKRPITGAFFKLFSPKIVPISRKRDDTWDHFMDQIGERSLVTILPEGRMKRKSGLDKHGNPMTVRGGVADILQLMKTGKMMIMYSGGLHHIQSPGQWFPRFFRKINVKTEVLDMASYIQRIKDEIEHPDNPDEFKVAVKADLQNRLEKFCVQ